jgi:LTXXQ motif family protein
MSKIIAAGVIALFIGTGPAAFAQAQTQGAAPSTQGSESSSAADASGFTDARIAVVKAALQLTPDQEKLWPPVESAIRQRAQNRQARIAAVTKRIEELRDRGPEALRDRDPIAFLQRRADALAQRSADLKKLAQAWEPLYKTLDPSQKRRMAFLAVVVLRDMREAIEERRSFDDDDDQG